MKRFFLLLAIAVAAATIGCTASTSPPETIVATDPGDNELSVTEGVRLVNLKVPNMT